MKLQLHVRKLEYLKYENFERYDDELDMDTTVYIDRHLVSFLNDLRRFTEEIVLLDTGGEVLASASGYYAFYKALASHLAFVWYDYVPHWVPALKDMQNISRSALLGVRTQDLGRDKSRIHWRMPRYVLGLFEYPVPGVSVFPLSMQLEYALTKYALQNHIHFYADDESYLEALNARLKQNIDFTVSSLDRHMIPRL